MRDPETGNSKGFGFVNYDSFEAADMAIECMNGQFLCNRSAVVQFAYKKDSKGERHGSDAERLLAAKQRAANGGQSGLRPHTMFAVRPGMNNSIVPPPRGTPGLVGLTSGTNAAPQMQVYGASTLHPRMQGQPSSSNMRPPPPPPPPPLPPQQQRQPTNRGMIPPPPPPPPNNMMMMQQTQRGVPPPPPPPPQLSNSNARPRPLSMMSMRPPPPPPPPLIYHAQHPSRPLRPPPMMMMMRGPPRTMRPPPPPPPHMGGGYQPRPPRW